jgi:hypothetical protein
MKTLRTKRLLLAGLLAVAAAAVGAQQASAATLTVCASGCAFSQIAPAIAAASPGDTVKVAAGTYSGGFTIDKSLKLVGAGAGATIIQGGGPVITVGVPSASTEPTVSIGGVTVTGGVNTSFGFAITPAGGGISIPAGANSATGATVTITESAISGNRVQVLQADSCGAGCTFAVVAGGGIDNAGTLTLNHATVSNNSAVSDISLKVANRLALGGGIQNYGVGTLTLHASAVTGNRLDMATATGAGAGTLAFGGGIDSDGPLTVDTSTISGNSISITNTTTSSDIGTLGLGGGIHIEFSGQATVRESTISGNAVMVSAPAGGGGAGGGGIDDDGSLLLLDSLVNNNHTSVTVTSSVPSSVFTGSDGGAMEVDGSLTVAGTTFSGNSVNQTNPAGSSCGGGAQGGALFFGPFTTGAISDSTFTGNSVHDSSTSGTGTCALGGAIFNLFSAVTLSDDVISGNTVSASTSTGTVNVGGGGIWNGGTLTLRDTTVASNSGTATGPSGTAQGGGIWNGDAGFGGPPQLTLTDSVVTHNTLSGSEDIVIHGGGLFSAFPVALTNSKISGNSPDNCSGVSC